MSHVARHLRLTESTTRLPGLPDKPMSSQEQLEAVEHVQNQADQRLQLGLKLFKAAEAHATKQQTLVDHFRHEQERLRDDVQRQVTSSLQSYDKWVGELNQGFTSSIKNLEERLDKLQDDWSGAQKRIEEMMKRSESLLERDRLQLTPTPPRKQASTNLSTIAPEECDSAQPPPVARIQNTGPGGPQRSEEADTDSPTYSELLTRLLDKTEPSS